MFSMLKSVMASPYDKGAEAFRKDKIPKDNPYPLNAGQADHRWYRWKSGWARARIDAIVDKEGTCAGAHSGNDNDESACDINGLGWESLGQYTSRCKTCGEVWDLDWGGWKHQVDETIARNPELGHSFRDDGVACTKCGARFAEAADGPCINQEDDENLTRWLDARDDLEDAVSALSSAEKNMKAADSRLSVRRCPRCKGDDICQMCRGEGTIGRKQNDD